MGKPARSLTKAIKDYLTLKGWHVQTGGSTGSFNANGQFYRTGEAGAPDLQAHKAIQILQKSAEVFGVEEKTLTRWLCIEVKAGKDRIRPAQAKWLGNAQKYGGATVIVARSLDNVMRVV